MQPVQQDFLLRRSNSHKGFLAETFHFILLYLMCNKYLS